MSRTVYLLLSQYIVCILSHWWDAFGPDFTFILSYCVSNELLIIWILRFISSLLSVHVRETNRFGPRHSTSLLKDCLCYTVLLIFISICFVHEHSIVSRWQHLKRRKFLFFTIDADKCVSDCVMQLWICKLFPIGISFVDHAASCCNNLHLVLLSAPLIRHDVNFLKLAVILLFEDFVFSSVFFILLINIILSLVR